MDMFPLAVLRAILLGLPSYRSQYVAADYCEENGVTADQMRFARDWLYRLTQWPGNERRSLCHTASSLTCELGYRETFGRPTPIYNGGDWETDEA